MAYKALYRTYRPQSFEEVAGQQAIVKTLKNALERNKIAHAYLFCGPRGTGKTTMAKLFAKALNCEEGQGHQCNHCENCVAITDGSHPDVMEIDAASNNGVEEVRNLIDKVKYLPIKGKYKVYIIDEVHMMSSGAFNALLKTLEEPPSHVVFILATTEPHKVLPTIISRCQRYDFSKVEDSDITNKIIEILDKEHVTYDLDALKVIVELADGGVRDALSMLDQVLAYSGDNVGLNDVLTLFAIASKKEKVELLAAVAQKDVRTVLEKMEEFVDKGIDIRNLVSNLLEMLRDLLVYLYGGESYQLISIREEDGQYLSQFINKKLCLEMIDILLKAQGDFKQVSNIRSLFEIVLLKLCSIEVAPEIARPVVEKTYVAPAPRQAEVKPEPKKEEPKVEPKVEAKAEEAPKQEKTYEEPPSWLFDDAPAEKNADEENLYSLDDDTIIKIMVLANRDYRMELNDAYEKLDTYFSHPILGKYASILKAGKPFCVGKDVCIIEYDLNSQVKKLNNIANQEQYEFILEKLTGKKRFVYGMSRADSVRLSKLYSNLRQVDQLPKPSKIVLELPNNKEN